MFCWVLLFYYLFVYVLLFKFLTMKELWQSMEREELFSLVLFTILVALLKYVHFCPFNYVLIFFIKLFVLINDYSFSQYDCRCGLTWSKNQKTVVLMLLRLTYFGMSMSHYIARCFIFDSLSCLICSLYLKFYYIYFKQ